MPLVGKAIFSTKIHGQGHKVIDLGVIWNSIIIGVCMPYTKCLSLTVERYIEV